jgi:putative FmdB family regulatory protein
VNRRESLRFPGCQEEPVPAYDYQCDQCGQTFEVRQRISEPALTACIHCGGPVRRLLAPAAFILKGGGWYVTDYPSDARKKATEAEKKSSAPAPAAASTGSTETAPATSPKPAADATAKS